MTALHTLPAYEPPRRRVPRTWRPVRAARPEQDRPPLPPGPTWGEPPQLYRRLARLMGMLLEVLDGTRAVAQLHLLTTEDVRAAAITRAREAIAAGVRYRLRRLRSCRPSDRAIELTAVVATGAADRDRAVVARLEHRPGGWVCTVLEVVDGQRPSA